MADYFDGSLFNDHHFWNGQEIRGLMSQTKKGRRYRADQAIPKNDDGLLVLAGDMADGLDQLETASGITGVTEADGGASIVAVRTTEKS